MKTKLFFSLMIIAVVFSACKGEKGDIGPQGNSGSANVSAFIVTINPGQWASSTAGYWGVSWTAPEITNANADVVQVYMQGTSGGDWWGLPTTNFFAAGDAIDFSYTTGSVSILYTNTTFPPQTVAFKTVVIPPAIARDHPEVDYNNYRDVKAIFNLADL